MSARVPWGLASSTDLNERRQSDHLLLFGRGGVVRVAACGLLETIDGRGVFCCGCRCLYERLLLNEEEECLKILNPITEYFVRPFPYQS